MSEPLILYDPTTGRPILMAPGRQGRPIHTARTPTDTSCPFCPGNEDQTPAELASVRTAGSAGGPGWSVRAFANLYPAAAHHEVIAEGSAHEEHPSALPAELWVDALGLWLERLREMEAHDDVTHTFWFKNVGRMAGASVAHNHSQILGIPMVLPRVALERDQAQRLGHCPFCADLEDAQAQGRIIHRDEHYALLCPANPKLPFESWLLPADHGEDLDALAHAQSLGRALHTMFRAVDGAFNGGPFNMYLHRLPGEDFHWHFELQPRSGYLAGLELGGDMYINAIPGAQAAERLRKVLT